jgi:diguanylate cyclase (GGDEF)-like protein/PAS domain S-box-containing protein
VSRQREGEGTTSAPLTSTTADDALDALLRRNPNALVAALGPNGMAPFPDSVERHGQTVFDRGVGMELVAPEDQVLVLDAWSRSGQEPVVRLDVHLVADPERLTPVHLFDVRAAHGVHVVVLEAADPELVSQSAGIRAALRRRAARVARDGLAVFLEVDDATTELLGWTAEELVGRRTVELVHPDDAERAIDAWMAMRSGTDTGRTRARYRHADGHYVWVEVTNDNRLQDPELGCVLSELVDISAEMAQVEELRDRERQLARLAGALPIGVCHVRADGEVLYCNEPLTALLGAIDSRAALVRSVIEVDRRGVNLALSYALRDRPVDLEVGVLQGVEERRCELTFRPVTNDVGDIDGVIVCAADVTDRSRLRAELEHRASHDALSGCLNRAATVAALEQALLTSPWVALAYIDLDGFKAVNDELGHAAGDELLRVAAARLQSVTRHTDRLGRIGGDEFVVICPQLHGAFEASELVARLSAALNDDVSFAGRQIPLRASIGVALSVPGDFDAEAVLVRADAAMYEAKGRARRPSVADLRIAVS